MDASHDVTPQQHSVSALLTPRTGVPGATQLTLLRKKELG
jgi:hypothetical protein